MRYCFKREDAIDFAERLGFETSERGGELWFKKCPYCGANSNDTQKFSINLQSGAYKCFRGSCGQQGHFAELARDFGYELADLKPVIYRQLPQKEIRVTDKAIDYLGSRGISADVVRLYKITSCTNQPNVIAFPFFDEKGIMQFIKYRNTAFRKGDSGSKEWAEKNAMPILFGMLQANDYTQPLVLTEGQIDSLSVATAGIANAVSVPMGMTNFKWLNWCLEWMQRFPSIIVFGDYENGKRTLIDTIQQRLDGMPVYCVREIDYLGEKDANDVLRSYGSQAIIKAIEKAEPITAQWIQPLESVQDVDISQIPKIETGIASLDEVIGGGMAVGQVVLLTGKRGDGKSTLMSQFLCNALDQGESIFAYSGELTDFHFKAWLNLQLAGADYLTTTKDKFGKDRYSVNDDAQRQISKWYSGRAYIYNNGAAFSSESQLMTVADAVEEAVKRYGVRLVAVDNLMTAVTAEKQIDLYQMQSNFVGRLKRIAVEYEVVIILVAHPRKQSTQKGKDTFANDDVSGSADVTNKVDIILNYKRGNAGSLLEITKNRLYGEIRQGDDALKLFYEAKSKRLSDNTAYKHYGWENVQNSVEYHGFKHADDEEELPFD